MKSNFNLKLLLGVVLQSRGNPRLLFKGGESKIKTKKIPPIKDEGYLMFSQRKNPYCELLQISESKNI